jgi:hypothetical protein
MSGSLHERLVFDFGEEGKYSQQFIRQRKKLLGISDSGMVAYPF